MGSQDALECFFPAAYPVLPHLSLRAVSLTMPAIQGVFYWLFNGVGISTEFNQTRNDSGCSRSAFSAACGATDQNEAPVECRWSRRKRCDASESLVGKLSNVGALERILRNRIHVPSTTLESRCPRQLLP